MMKKKNKRSLVILLVLLFLALVVGAFWLFNQPQPEADVKEIEVPIVLSEEEIWFANLDTLNTMAYPEFVCETFISTDITVPIGNGETITYLGDSYVEGSDFRFIVTPNEPSYEEFFPVITAGVEFERCSVNVPVVYTETVTGENETTLEPDLSSVDSMITKYGVGANGEAVSWNAYNVDDNMSDAISNEVFLTNQLSVETIVTEEEYSVTETVNEVISIAFQTAEETGNPPESELDELRSRVTEEQYKILNDIVEEVLS